MVDGYPLVVFDLNCADMLLRVVIVWEDGFNGVWFKFIFVLAVWGDEDKDVSIVNSK